MNFVEATTRPLPYCRDAAEWASRFADLPGFALLDSRKRRAEVGQFDIITALPDEIYRLSDYQGRIDLWLGAVESDLGGAPQAGRARLAIGFLDFDSAAAALGVPGPALIPAMAGVYSWHILQDHHLGRAWLVTHESLCPDTLAQVEQRLAADTIPELSPFALESDFVPELPREAYANQVARIRRYIADGDCYQVNFAHRFSTRCRGDAFNAYCQLRDVAPGDFSAYLALDEGHRVLSLSPERFLSCDGARIKTQPIKGTRSRGATPLEDQRLADELRHSPKDRAENVMIVDLLRNDLGKVCKVGSVHTTELCALHSFDNVHHLVSMVEGELRAGISPSQALAACSPGGSITGAPKRRAVEIIRELESSPRGVYCGSVFAMAGDGWLQSSIAIRTLEVVGNSIYCWGGGGIVHDSDAEAEYQETLDKVGIFMATLNAG